MLGRQVAPQRLCLSGTGSQAEGACLGRSSGHRWLGHSSGTHLHPGPLQCTWRRPRSVRPGPGSIWPCFGWRDRPRSFKQRREREGASYPTTPPKPPACLQPLLRVVSRFAVPHEHKLASALWRHLAEGLLVALLRLDGPPLRTVAHALAAPMLLPPPPPVARRAAGRCSCGTVAM